LTPQTDVEVDLLVPASVSPGKGRRSAHLAGHDSRAARIVRGLEGVLVDADLLPIRSLEPADTRVFEIGVAGPAALLVAKLTKIDERKGTPRLVDKDALDILRILKGVSTTELARRMALLEEAPASSPEASKALDALRSLFGKSDRLGSQMAVRAARGRAAAEEVAGMCETLAKALLEAMATHKP
jgi:hypothetical protein